MDGVNEMRLSADEAAMLGGEGGPATALAMRVLLAPRCPVIAMRAVGHRWLHSGDQVLIEESGRIRVRPLT